MQVYNIPFGSWMGTGPAPPPGGQGAHCQCFLALMVGALGSPAQAPPRGLAVNIFYVDGERSWISVSTHQGGSTLTFLSVDDGRSQISSSGTSQGARRRHFLALMVDALGFPAMIPPRGPAVDVF
jgi:hypothetical protein